MNELRCYRIIKQALKKFNLYLSGLRVLTEAASGYYILTPIIATLAGAEKVFALTSDSKYGSAKTVSKMTLSLTKKWGVDQKIDIRARREAIQVALRSSPAQARASDGIASKSKIASYEMGG